ncbi:conserved hypothetical protein [Ixodes scapularis]|uniref:Uncharacterized protein n=1 Tax=Ixodes scapularis TaxID=6945 RepID=B7QMR0_IXOSC|nr:conserved hypothetical protein [Ixodes scapularis]|eukprot:XP_002400095.1 conserved hypothetical protein [Ixodes scapularis]
MKIFLLWSYVLAAGFVVQAEELCNMGPERLSSTLRCVSNKISTELQEKVYALNNDGTPFPEFIRKHCDLGTDYREILRNNLSEQDIAAIKDAYLDCTNNGWLGLLRRGLQFNYRRR